MTTPDYRLPPNIEIGSRFGPTFSLVVQEALAGNEQRFGRWTKCRGVGDLSYGLYIYGWPIEQGIVYFSGGAAPWWAVFGVALAVAVPTAFLSWHGIERRCRWRARPGKPVTATPAGAAASG